MSDYTLVIGSKNVSSWSMRPWLLMRQFGIPFSEILVPLDRDDTAANIAVHSPSGRVPVLKIGDEIIWDSLAIIDTLGDRHPGLPIWPVDPAARAHARSAAAEMHSGFLSLRDTLPMDCMLRVDTPVLPDDAVADISRVCDIWREARARAGRDGPFLFGAFSAADAMYAPVASRFRSYAIELDEVCSAYVDAVFALPAMQAWLEGAAAEVPADD